MKITQNYDYKTSLNDEAILARKLLEETGISIIDAARIIKNILDFTPESSKTKPIQFCTKVIDSGIKHLHIKDMSIENGFALYLKTKAELRPASINDIKYLGRRLFRHYPNFAKMNFAELSLADCEKWLNKAFRTAPQFNKGHRMLSGFFNYAMRQEWADRNIVKLIKKKKVVENEIKALSTNEIKALLETAQLAKYKDCQAAVALQIWAGIRPQELKRLAWKDIDLDESIITIRPTTSKTGGTRHIEIPKVLKLYLIKIIASKKRHNLNIVPANWHKKWKALRKQAGFKTWTQDVLRHTYASYYAKHFQNLSKLQSNMGHHNLQLLRTRYINLHNISKTNAKIYFNLAPLKVQKNC